MALPTYIDIVNNVLKRLRELPVTSVGDTEYSRLISLLVNDSKREIENSNDWLALRTSATVTTVAGTDTYTLSTLTEDFSVKDVYNTTYPAKMIETTDQYINDNTYLGTPVNAVPTHYTFKGRDTTTGAHKVRLFPNPDGVYSVVFEVVKRQDDLVNDSDRPLVSGYLIELLTTAKAIAERGEDGGSLSNQVFAQYLASLSDAIALEKGRSSLETIWSTV